MSPQTFTIWCNAANFDAALRALLTGGAQPHRVVFPDEQAGRHENELLAEADIAFGQPNPELAMNLAGLRWVHLNSAGYTAYDRADLRAALVERGTPLTNSSGVYDEPCAQHLLAMMLALARQLPQALDEQRGTRAWSDLRLRADSVLLGGQTALIFGFGAIARRVVELLRPFEMNVVGVRRRVAGDEPLPVVTTAESDDHLPLAEHVINILPANKSTRKFFDARRFALIKRGAIFYNIGRGATVEQAALVDVLTSGQLSAAYLDVTDPEPLPPEHPLWSLPNCYITPHTAGGHANEGERLVRHFLANLQKFTAGEPLIDRVF